MRAGVPVLKRINSTPCSNKEPESLLALRKPLDHFHNLLDRKQCGHAISTSCKITHLASKFAGFSFNAYYFAISTKSLSIINPLIQD